MKDTQKQTIAVGMSGGVDSSIAAALLKSRGHNVFGITARTWPSGSRCCADEDVQAARKAAEMIGIEHHTVDLMRDFERDIVRQFAAEYAAGRGNGDNLPQVIRDIPVSPDQFKSGRLPLARLPWKYLAKCLLDKPTEPRMDVIVAIAQEFEPELRRMLEHPRRVLRGERCMTPLGRVQQLDATCLEWLVRQPGRSNAQRAGTQQEVLSVVRVENFDTLENRVLKDFLRRCDEAATLYLRQARMFAGSRRCSDVRRLQRLCRQALELEPFPAIANLFQPPSPNYVLQYDASYSKLWRWYGRLVRRQRELDDAWRWQRRLWADMVRLGVVAALYEMESKQEKEMKLDTPPYEHTAWLREEQSEGCWISEIDFPGPLVIRSITGQSTVVECIHPRDQRSCCSHRRKEVLQWCGMVGADLALLFSPLGTKRSGQVCAFVWAIHGASEAIDDTDVRKQTRSAANALKELSEEHAQSNVQYKGLILRSVLSQQTEEVMDMPPGNDVDGLCLPAAPSSWRKELLKVLGVFIGMCAGEIS